MGDVSSQPGRTQLVRQQDFARSSKRGDFTFAWRSRLFAWNYVSAVRVCLPPHQLTPCISPSQRVWHLLYGRPHDPKFPPSWICEFPSSFLAITQAAFL